MSTIPILKLRLPLCLLVVFAVLAAACGPTPTPETIVQTVIETVVVTEVVEIEGETVVVTEIVEVEKEVIITPTPAAEVVPEVDQVLVIGMARDTGPLNPHIYSYQNFVPLTMVFESLVVYNADGSIGPGLAETWKVSDDGLTWTFNLRQGVTFHDGTPFNADAAKWNLERWVGTQRHSWMPTSNTVDSIETPDDYTVVMKMKNFYYAAIQDLTLVRPVRFLSPSSVDADGEFVSAVGTGAWRLEEWVPDQRSLFVRNDDYWGELPTLENVILEVIPDAQTRIAALLSGEVHLIGGEYIGGISLESIPVLERNSQVQLLSDEGSTSYLVMLNYNNPPFNDPLVRRAINHAIDREAISTQLFQGLASPAEGVFPANVPYVTHNPEFYTYDPGQSESLLAEAGWVPGADGILEKGGQRFEVTMVVDAGGFPQAKSIAEVMQAALAELGIDMEVRLMEFGGWSEAVQSGDYDLSTNITWGAPYDPHSSLSGMFYQGFTGTEGTVFTDPQLDTMIDQVLMIVDEDERQAAYNDIWQFLDENAAAIPIVYSLRLYALDGSVNSYHLAGTEYDIDLLGVSIGGN